MSLPLIGIKNKFTKINILLGLTSALLSISGLGAGIKSTAGGLFGSTLWSVFKGLVTAPGAFFVLYFLFLLNILIESFKKQSRIFSLFLGVIAFLTLIAIFLTYSRSALLMLIVGAFVFLFLNTKKTQAILVVVIFLLSTTLVPKAYKTEGTNFFRIASSEARLGSAKQAIEIIRKNPFFGVGFNAYRYAKSRYGFQPSMLEGSHADAGTDNSFLFLLATTGVIGFIAYLYMWFKILKINIRSKLLIASISALFVDSLFVNSLFYSFLMFWIWALVGLYGE